MENNHPFKKFISGDFSSKNKKTKGRKISCIDDSKGVPIN